MLKSDSRNLGGRTSFCFLTSSSQPLEGNQPLGSLPACTTQGRGYRSRLDLPNVTWPLNMHNVKHIIRPPPSVSIEEQVVRVYFKNFAFLYQSQDTVRGFLPYLVPMYGASEEGSALRVATHAAALCAISQLPGQRQLAFRAASAYGEAIKTVATALKSPSRARSDETLQATLLLSLYEASNFSGSHGDHDCAWD